MRKLLSLALFLVGTAINSLAVSWIVTYPTGGRASSVDDVQIKCLQVAYRYLSEDASATLLDASDNVVKTIVRDDITLSFKGTYCTVDFEFNPAITAGGAYTIAVPAGILSTSAGAENEAFTVNFTVEAPTVTPSDVTAMPENGSSVAESTGIQAIYLTVDGYKYVAANTSGITGSITKNGAAYATLDASVLSVAMDQTSAVVTLPEQAQMNTAGTYVVSLPEGFFTMKSKTDSEADNVDSPAIELTYTITAVSNQLSWTISPAPGEVDKIDRVSITFSKPVKIARTNNVFLFYTNYSYLPETVTDGYITLADGGLVANLDFSPVFADGGVFQIRIYEGNEQLAVVDGEHFPGINITYKVTAPLYTECTPEEGSSVTSIDEVKIKLRRNIDIAESNFSAVFRQGDKEVPASLERLVPYDWGDPSYIVVKADEPITEPGEWTLVLAEGSLTISNYGESMQSPETSVNFTVSGTTGIGTLLPDGTPGDYLNGTPGDYLNGSAAGYYLNGAPCNVYTPLGVCVKRGATAADIRALPSGLYIINGHKLAIP